MRHSLDGARIRKKKGKFDFNASAVRLVAIRPCKGKATVIGSFFLKGRKESASEVCRAFI